MQIFIKGLAKIRTVNNVSATDSTKRLYELVSGNFGISSNHYYLQHNRIISCSDKETLGDYGIGKESTVHIRFRSGGKPCVIR